VVLLVLAVGVSACGGGGDPRTTGDPTATASSSSTTPTPTPTPTPTAAPTAEPLSPFEDRPEVKALRAYFVALGRAINARDRDLGSMAAFATPAGVEATRSPVAGDIEHGYLWPGPEPFTPVAVRSKKGKATVSVCIVTIGWSVYRKTGRPVFKPKERKVGSVIFDLVRSRGSWKVDGFVFDDGNCASVKIRRVRW
jgi:hypothetical protein